MAARRAGMTKINLNRTVRDDYTAFMADNSGKLELTELKTKAVEVYTKSIAGAMESFLGSAGKVS